MILIEHAIVVTVDRERRILTDGSVLVDGRNIVQVGRPAPCARRGPPPGSSTAGAAWSFPASWTPTSTSPSTSTAGSSSTTSPSTGTSRTG